MSVMHIYDIIGCFHHPLEEELGRPLEALFSKISAQTIAAASLGQVYRATLRETGEDVAIKVV